MAVALGELVGVLFGFVRSFKSTTHFVVCNIVCRFMFLLCEEMCSKLGRKELHWIRGKIFSSKLLVIYLIRTPEELRKLKLLGTAFPELY